MSFGIQELDAFLLVGSLVILLAIGAVWISGSFGLPTLLLYLGIGVLLGEGGIGIAFENAGMAQALGFLALIVILAEGGLTTSWREVKPTFKLGLSLATLGTATSILVLALLTHHLLGMPWELAILVGAVLSPTDAAAVFSVLRTVPLPRKLTGALENESGLNDAPTVALVMVVSSGAIGESPSWALALLIVYELVAGGLIGLLCGWISARLIRRLALPSSGLYPLTIMCLAILAYALGVAAHASGFAAVYVAALVLGNAELPHRVATRSFAEGLAWLCQIGLFVMLGLLAAPLRIGPGDLVFGVAIGAMLTFVARPISVLIASTVSHLSMREVAFISWAGLRGAVPVVLCTIPMAANFPGSDRLFDIVFVLVVVYTLITAPTLPLVARWLGVALSDEPRGVELEVAPLERVAADLIQVTITDISKLHGVAVAELRLPRGASVSMLVREGQLLVPDGRTQLRHGDDLLVVTPRKLRDKVEKRLRQVSRGGRLASWNRRLEAPDSSG